MHTYSIRIDLSLSTLLTKTSVTSFLKSEKNKPILEGLHIQIVSSTLCTTKPWSEVLSCITLYFFWTLLEDRTHQCPPSRTIQRHILSDTFFFTSVLPALQNSPRFHLKLRIFVSSFSLENMSTVDWLSRSIHPFGIATSSWIEHTMSPCKKAKIITPNHQILQKWHHHYLHLLQYFFVLFFKISLNHPLSFLFTRKLDPFLLLHWPCLLCHIH